MTTAHASKTKIANASNDKSRIFGPHYSPTHQTASLSERIIASGGTGADRRSNTGAPLRSPAAARSPGSSQPYSRHLKATGALAHQLLALLVRQVSGYAAAYSPELSTMEEGGGPMNSKYEIARTPGVVLVLVVAFERRVYRREPASIVRSRTPWVISGNEFDRSAFSQEASTTSPSRWLRRLLLKLV